MFSKLREIKRKFLKKKYRNYFLKDNLKKDILSGYAQVGKWSYGNPKIYRWNRYNKLIIGNYCSLGPNVSFFIGGDHRTDWITTCPLPAPQFSFFFNEAKNIKDFNKSKGDIIIGHDVWIGGNSLILSGSEIGTGAVIAAGSLVNSKIEPYSIVGGNPAKLIKKRFLDEDIKKILDSKWWELNDQIINKLSRYLLSDNIDEFIEKIKKL